MDDSTRSYEAVANRRRFLKLTGIPAAAVLAGCSGGGGGADTTGDGEETPPGSTEQGTTTDDGQSPTGDEQSPSGSTEQGTTEGTGNVYDAQHIAYTPVSPANAQWNVSNPTNQAGISNELLFDEFAKWSYAQNEFVPYAITEWNHGGDRLELTVRDGLTWANGEAVTAQDIATQLRIGLHTGLEYASFTETIEMVDEKTVRMNFETEVNPDVATFSVLARRWVSQPDSVFGEYLDRITQDGSENTQSDSEGAQNGSATTQETQEGLRSLREFAWTEPIASGPWKLRDVGQQQALLERHAEHPDAGNINFSQYACRYLDGNQAVHQALINSDIDSVTNVFTPGRVVDQLPDAITEVGIPSQRGYALFPNHEHQHAGDRAVRKAIQHVLNRKQIANNVAESKTPTNYPMAIPNSSQEEWLSRADGEFQDYGPATSQTEQATQILEDAGYQKSGGTWQDSDGNTVELPIVVPSGWSDWVTAVQTTVDQLTSFGFNSAVDSRQFSSLSSNAWQDGNFVITAGGSLPGAPISVYPYFSLRHQMLRNIDGISMNYPPADEEQGGSTGDVTLPARTGDGEMTVNPADRITELAQTTEESTITEITLEQLWVSNQDLPIISVMDKLDQSFVTGGDEWEIPNQDGDVMQVRWPNTWLPRQGKMQYTGN